MRKNILVIALAGITGASIRLSAESAMPSQSGAAVIPPAGMVLVESGGKSFEMGCSSAESRSIERPVHTVRFTRNFYMDTTEVTQEDYSTLMAQTYPSYTKPGFGCPGNKNTVNNINWYDAVLYCNAQSRREGRDTVFKYTSRTGTPGNGCVLEGVSFDLTRSGYRLPTESEWEFAYRAGTTTDFYWGTARAGDYTWYADNSGETCHTVAQKKPNAWRLYDMSGNVWEWCIDYMGNYPGGTVTDPVCTSGGWRILRGGSYHYGVYEQRASNRASKDPTFRYSTSGFRCALTHKSDEPPSGLLPHSGAARLHSREPRQPAIQAAVRYPEAVGTGIRSCESIVDVKGRLLPWRTVPVQLLR